MKVSSQRMGAIVVLLSLIILVPLLHPDALAQKPRPPAGGRRAVVVDERLAALRDSPHLSGKLLKRLGRGRLVGIRGQRRDRDGVIFYRIDVTTRTAGWIQSAAVVILSGAGDDERLFSLIKASEDFDRIARARIFLDAFRKSPFRPAVLLLFGDAADAAAAKLSRDASRRLNTSEMSANDAPEFSYFLNYNGLDRYSRQGIGFGFDRERKRFRYDGVSWREIIRRYPRSQEASEARKRLDSLTNSKPSDP